MDKRQAVIGVGAFTLAGCSAFAAQQFFVRRNGESHLTLRRRIIDLEKKARKTRPPPNEETLKKVATDIMNDYFKIGMTNKECIQILKKNDLNPEIIEGPRRGLRFEKDVFFYFSIVSSVYVPSGYFFMSLRYDLSLNFKEGVLDEIIAHRFFTAP